MMKTAWLKRRWKRRSARRARKAEGLQLDDLLLTHVLEACRRRVSGAGCRGPGGPRAHGKRRDPPVICYSYDNLGPRNSGFAH